MKKFLAIPLLFLYTLAVSGVMIQMHFCGSNLESWNVTAANSACCCERGDEPAHKMADDAQDCCTDKTLVIKAVQDQYLSSGIQLLFGDWQPVASPIAAVFHPTLPATAQVFVRYRSNAPPGLWQDIPLFLLHQRFIVYS